MLGVLCTRRLANRMSGRRWTCGAIFALSMFAHFVDEDGGLVWTGFLLTTRAHMCDVTESVILSGRITASNPFAN